jgi:twinkle protein
MAKHKHESDSELVTKGPCASCGSSDACALYDDGHSFCFSCGTLFPAEGDAPRTDPEPLRLSRDLIRGELEPLRKRRLDLKTVERFGYRVGTFKGKPVQIAPYRDAAGREVAQKLRFPDKEMIVVGDLKAALPLFGQSLWRDAGKQIVITEGEIDAMSYAQATGLRWPAVSIPNGAQGAAKAVAAAADWLERFERVVLMFDMDEPGRKAAEEAARVLTPGKAFIATLPLKDANEMVQAGRSKELVDLAWEARAFRPDGIRRVSDLRARALKPPSYGLPYPWRGPTEALYGIRRRELIGWGAGVGVGKTTLFKQLILATAMPSIIEDHDGLLLPPGALEPRKVGTMLLEENPEKTLRTLAGMSLGQRVHVPGVEVDEKELGEAMDRLDPYLFAYEHFGAKDWQGIKDLIRYMVLAEGIKDVFLDHLTALIAFAEDDRKALDEIMADLASLVEQHDFTLHFISHLTTPTGTAHEEGGRVLEKHFTGSRAIARWSHNLFALERDKQNPAEPTTFRILKERETGDAVGRKFGLAYDRDSGLFKEVPLEEESGGFKDESKPSDF